MPQTTNTQIEQPVPTLNSFINSGSEFLNTFKGSNGLLLLLTLSGLLLIAWLGKGQKGGKLARGFLAGGKEKQSARKVALQQIKKRTYNAVTLYAGTPKRNQKGELHPRSKTLWIPDAQRGIAVCGGPGSGKTKSIINPAIRATIDQELPILMYDFKYPEQAELIIPYAAKRGYEVKVFAPGFQESEVCNPLDFLKNQDDALMARQIASIMNKNFALSANASEDKFFSDAGDQLTQAMLMLAKGLPESDILTASTILSLPKLPERIQAAWDQGEVDKWKMSQWVYLAFSQMLQLAGSEKTIAGVVGTASKVFSRFLSPELVGAFCGKTTLPLDLTGKKLVVLGLDRQRRDAVAPLVATVLHMIVTRNAINGRTDPFIVAIDELPTIYLPTLTQWLNENRSFGQVTIIGFQNMNQLEKAYGREISRAIFGGCATKVIFNPQESDSARMFSEYLGEEDLTTKSKSRSTGKGGQSTSIGDQIHKRAIVEAAQFNKFIPGKCVFLNPAYARNDEGYIPLVSKVVLSKEDEEAEQQSHQLWSKVQQRLIANSRQRIHSEEESQKQIALRMAIGEKYFPVSQKEPPSKVENPETKRAVESSF